MVETGRSFAHRITDQGGETMIDTAQVTWVEGMQFVGEAGSGHAIVLDGGKGSGGRDTAMSPMELVLVGLTSCTAMDVKFILQRKRQQVTGVQVKAEAERADRPPKVYTDIKLAYTLRGRGLSEKAVVDAINLSQKKYCSASVMLGKTAEISYTYQVIQEPEG
jgi:putative redox protein